MTFQCLSTFISLDRIYHISSFLSMGKIIEFSFLFTYIYKSKMQKEGSSLELPSWTLFLS